MNTKHLYPFFCALIFSASLDAKVIEAQSFHDITPIVNTLNQAHGPEHVLLVFDFDDTLLTTKSQLGGVHWFNWQESLLKTKEDEPTQVAHNFGALLSAQGLLNEWIDMKPVEKNLSAWVKTLQQKNPSLVLTARGPLYMYDTLSELAQNGYDFSQSPLAPKDISEESLFYPYEKNDAELIKSWNLSEDQVKSWKVERNPRLAGYSKGVFFTAGQHKGLMLKRLMELSQYKEAKAIVFVDDSEKNVSRVNDTFSHFKTPVYSFHYTALAHELNEKEMTRLDKNWRDLLKLSKEGSTKKLNRKLKKMNR